MSDEKKESSDLEKCLWQIGAIIYQGQFSFQDEEVKSFLERLHTRFVDMEKNEFKAQEQRLQELETGSIKILMDVNEFLGSIILTDKNGPSSEIARKAMAKISGYFHAEEEKAMNARLDKTKYLVDGPTFEAIADMLGFEEEGEEQK